MTTPSQIAAPPPANEIRDELQRLVLEDLLGPKDGPEEELPHFEDRVKERYIVGVLAPKKEPVNPNTLDEIAQAGTDTEEEGKTDVTAVQSGTLFPSSMGLTFMVDEKTEALTLTAKWGRYDRIQSQTQWDDKSQKYHRASKRTPVEGVTPVPVPIREGKIDDWIVTEEQPDVVVQGRMRKVSGGFIVTLFLVNGQTAPPKNQPQDEAWLFQAELIVEAPDGRPAFIKRMTRNADVDKLDPVSRSETLAYAMLYRRRVEFAVGHSTGVHAVVSPEDPSRADRLETRAMPFHEVPQTTPPTPEDNPDLGDILLDMKTLSETPDDRLSYALYPLADAYEKWIEREAAKVDDPDADLNDHRQAAAESILKCRDALRRIREGIALLSQDGRAADAFRFANRSMWLQRIRSIFSKQVRKGQRKANSSQDDIDIPENRTWYPFQLAFILLNLPSITDLHHPDRSHETGAIADLLWFPTGGGKTEAYLGLAAYTMALRRLSGEIGGRSGDHGVAVIMRYTLRLLTLQQFQRAAALICACDIIRKETPDKWGDAPFRIGLWVGRKATPNFTRQSLEAVTQSRRRSGSQGVGSPAQLTSCPWCGTAIEPGRNILVLPGMSNPNRTYIYCGDALGRCPFSQKKSPNEGIPALVVDEEIYRHPPSLLIATVDKFAQMPWKGPVQMLFGQVNKYCPRHGFRSPEIEDQDSHPKRGNLPGVRSHEVNPLRPPDLIIQDELHLISGPLGSMVGLYETAVDHLCSWEVDGKTVRPKVIASTATIRRAEQQVNKLFLRNLAVFPPHGTDIEDNFFSLQREPDETHPGRRYLGVCAMGRRFPGVLIRVYIVLLAAAQKLYGTYDAAADPWMTLAGYFNSIRELGGTRRLVEDEIRSRLRNADERGLAKRISIRLEELTSRKSSADIPSILDRLDIGFSQADEQRRLNQKRNGANVDQSPLDVVLATNMISVGVDVDRLGLMAVAGQPKSTSEYIQATSRVGRKFPGLVVTIYNWARPRDLSHYERFEHYHATFYQHVEALSVTPFAPRAMDRGLSGILVSLIRLTRKDLNENSKAGDLTSSHPLLSDAEDAILARARLIDGDGAADVVREMLDRRKTQWLAEIAAAQSVTLGYQQKRDGTTIGLLRPAGSGPWEPFTCLNSLRDVEPSIHLVLKDNQGLTLSDPPSTDPEPSGDDDE